MRPMAIEIRLRRVRTRGGQARLAPADALAEKALAGMPETASGTYKAKITAERSGPRNRWAHALFAKVAAALGDERWTAEAIKVALKIRCGLVDVFRFKRPRPVIALDVDGLSDAELDRVLRAAMAIKGVRHARVETDREIEVPRSVAFDRMDEAEFAAFCDRAVRIIVTELLPGLAEDDLRREIDEMIGVRAAA